MAETGKILIVDDDEKVLKQLMQDLSKENYQVDVAKNGEMALRKIADTIPDIILLDEQMPNMAGIEVCRRIKSNYKYSFIYVIMLTSRRATEAELSGVDNIADDYIEKPYDRQMLIGAVYHGLQIMEKRIVATFDPLTKLYNRRIFDAFLGQETAKFKRYGRLLSLIMLDLDKLERVNRKFGIHAGDEVLKEVASILRKHTRETDLPTRLGGEELAILLPETDEIGAEILAKRLCSHLAEHRFMEVGHITASFGVACTSDANFDLIKAADQALYKAKLRGGNQVVVA